MQLTISRPLRAAFSLICGLFAFLILAGSPAFAAQPTAQDEAKMVGKWFVSASGTDRIYDITAGRNLKIVGSGIKDRRGHLLAQENGSYIVRLDGEETLKLVYTASSDELRVEFYRSKKDLDMGLPAHWSTTAKRKDH